MYDSSWEDFREESLRHTQIREETMLKKWLADIGYTYPIGYSRESWNKTLTIYTSHPGLLIGKSGEHIDKLQKMASDEFYGDWKVELVEVHGGFVSI